eukprot:1522437-Amphidinium_carterae.3
MQQTICQVVFQLAVLYGSFSSNLDCSGSFLVEISLCIARYNCACANRLFTTFLAAPVIKSVLSVSAECDIV